ncbi:type VII secretion protein EccE [Streptomyces sp. NPDC000594]|uniref:type VII secretion protein EccE n=1 Tax=Streptomyces sp. NPDC000594 TaxID=3154261 RepID=UPI00332986A5
MTVTVRHPANDTPDAPPPAAAPRPRDPGAPLLGVPLAHLVAWEVTGTLAAVAVLGPDPARAPALLGAALLGALTTVRLRRRWLYAWLAARLRLWARSRAGGTAPGGPLAPLRTLLPGLTVRRAEGRSRTPLGLVHDGRAWVCLVAVDPGDARPDSGEPGGQAPPPAPEPPLRELSGLLRLDDLALDSVQLLVHTVTAPAGADAASPLCATAHRQLNPAAVPLLRQLWVALRLDGTACPEAVRVRGGGEPGVRRVLRRGALAAVAVLERAGFPARVLDEAEAAHALAEAAGLPTGADGGAGEGTAVTETWTGLRTGSGGQITFRLRHGGSGPPRLRELLDPLAEIPVRASVLAVTFTRPEDCTVALRVTDTTGGTPEAVARALGGRLERLDGSHAEGLLATVPLGLPPGPRAPRCPVPAGPLARTAGVVIGTGHDGRPEALPLLRREPLRLGVLLSHDRAVLLVFRLLAAGAEVRVRSPHPQAWAPLLRASGADPARLAVGLPGGPTPPPGGPLRPVVIVDEFIGGTGTPRPDLGPWQTGISLHRRAPAGGVRALRRYDAVLAPRLPSPLARELAEAYGLPAPALRTLPLLPPDATALVRDGELRTLWLRPVPAESSLTLPPRPGHVDG